MCRPAVTMNSALECETVYQSLVRIQRSAFIADVLPSACKNAVILRQDLYLKILGITVLTRSFKETGYPVINC